MIRLDHTSRLAASWMADAERPLWREIDGSWVLVDLSGFTRLTERLAGSGAEGVEVLYGALSRCFEALLGRSMALGGDVLGFAGDAALVHFDGDHHLAHAVLAASSMPPQLAALPASLTGGRRLQVSIGVHTGTVTALLAGSGEQRLLFCGPEMSLLARLQAVAQPGQVMMSEAVAAALSADRCGAVIPPGVELRGGRGGDRWAAHPGVPPAGPDDAPRWSSIAVERSFRLLSPAVRELVEADVAIGDHRAASVGFVMVAGLDACLASAGPDAVHPVLEAVVDTIVQLGSELSLDLLDTDVGADCVKFFLAAGAPRAVPDDEGRLLLALRLIVDQCAAAVPAGVTVRAGGQRGRVFAGRLGVPGRSTYTVIGDPVNVAARALGVAGAGDVVVGDGLGADRRTSVTAVGLGALPLRNRVRPAELWRVESVARSPSVVHRASSASIDIARRREWAAVLAAWKRAENGVGGAVVVCGEPGMGVSSLVGEATATAGAAATLLEPHPFARHVPFGLIAVLVQALARAAGDELGDGGWSWLLRHRRRLPDHLQSWSVAAVAVARGDGPLPGGDPRTMARRSQRALAALLAAAAPRPWMLAVDDVDAADESSQSVLAELCGLTRGEAVLLVLGARSAVLGASVGLVMGTTVELLAVNDAVAEALVLDAAPLLRPDQVERILAAGKGNPFVLVELARNPSAGELPDSLQRLGAVLIDALPAAMRGLVRDASTFGATVSLDVMAGVLARPELADAATWRPASSVMRQSGEGSLAFVHDAYRAVAHESLTFRRRRELHGAIADHMMAHGARAAGGLALHLQLAGRLSEALPVATAAGLAAKQSGALAEAGELLGRADDMARSAGDESSTRLLLELGETLSWLGEGDGAEKAFRRAARRRLSPGERARLSHLVADHAMRRGEYRRGRAWIRRGLAAADSEGAAGARWRCEMLLDEAGLHADLGRQTRALRSCIPALEIAERLDDLTLRGKAHLGLEISYSLLMDELAIVHGDAAVRCFELDGNDRYLASAYNNVALTSMYLGRWQEALERYERSRAHSTRAGRPIDVAIVDMNVGFLLHRQGRQAEADVYACTALRMVEMLGARRNVAYGLLLRGMVAGAEHRFDDAEAWVALARADFAEVGDTTLVVDCDTVRLAHLLAARRVDEVLASAPDVERRLAVAEVEVVIAFDRTVGHALVLAGDRSGVERVRRALLRARAKRMVYDEYLCLQTLVALAGELPPTEVVRARRARDAIVTKLCIVGPSPVVP